MPVRYFYNLLLLIFISFSFQQCGTLGGAERAASIQSGLDNDDQLSTFAQLVATVGGLDKLLPQPEKKHTFFVPTNAAFDLLGQQLLDNMSLPDNQDVLLGVLQSHVAEGVYGTAEIEKSTSSITSVFDTPINLSNNSAQILYSIKAKNGVIHVIDKVIQR
jgi:uncharacterized surface protein with fasciclin (FAS1) repeats